MEKFWTFMIVVIGGIVAVFAIIFGLAVPLSYAIDRPSCLAKIERMGVPGTWGLWTDCMVKVNGRWVPLRAVHEVNGELDGAP